MNTMEKSNNSRFNRTIIAVLTAIMLAMSGATGVMADDHEGGSDPLDPSGERSARRRTAPFRISLDRKRDLRPLCRSAGQSARSVLHRACGRRGYLQHPRAGKDVACRLKATRYAPPARPSRWLSGRSGSASDAPDPAPAGRPRRS